MEQEKLQIVPIGVFENVCPLPQPMPMGVKRDDHTAIARCIIATCKYSGYLHAVKEYQSNNIDALLFHYTSNYSRHTLPLSLIYDTSYMIENEAARTNLQEAISLYSRYSTGGLYQLIESLVKQCDCTVIDQHTNKLNVLLDEFYALSDKQLIERFLALGLFEIREKIVIRDMSISELKEENAALKQKLANIAALIRQ